MALLPQTALHYNRYSALWFMQVHFVAVTLTTKPGPDTFNYSKLHAPLALQEHMYSVNE